MDLTSLARLARSRFPGAYDNIDDETLGAAYAKKHRIPVDPPKKETGAWATAKALGQGIKETVVPAEGIGDVLEGPAYALRHPIDSAKLLFGAAQDASQDQFEKMYKAPTMLEGAGHAVAGALPFVGPAAGVAGERIGQLGVDNQEGARGIGNALGMLLGGKVVNKGMEAVQGAMANRVGARPPVTGTLDPASMPEVPMLRSEAAGGGGIAKLERALESSIPGAGPFEAFRRVQQDALIDDLGAATTGRMAQPGANLRPYDIGQVLKEALTNATEDTRTGLHRGYAKLGKEMRDTPVDLGPIKNVANKRLEDIVSNNLIPESASELKALEPFVGDARLATFDSARAFRTATRKGEIPFHKDVRGPMVDAATEALRTAASKKGQLPRMERLDKGWADYENTFQKEGAKIPTMRDKLPPEETHKAIVGASLDDINNIKKSIGPQSFRDVKARILQDVMEEAMSGELDTSPSTMDRVKSGLGRLTGGLIDDLPIQHSGRRLSGKKFRNILEDKNRFGEERLSAIFDGPKELEAVKHFTDVAERVSASPSSLVGAFINASLITKAMSGTGKAIYGDIPGALQNFGEAASIYGTVNVGSRMMTGQLNPTRIMSRVISKSGGAKAMANYIEALAKKNGKLPESIRFKVPDQSMRGKAYFWGRIVGKMAQDEAERMEKEGIQ